MYFNILVKMTWPMDICFDWLITFLKKLILLFSKDALNWLKYQYNSFNFVLLLLLFNLYFYSTRMHYIDLKWL